MIKRVYDTSHGVFKQIKVFHRKNVLLEFVMTLNYPKYQWDRFDEVLDSCKTFQNENVLQRRSTVPGDEGIKVVKAMR